MHTDCGRDLGTRTRFAIWQQSVISRPSHQAEWCEPRARGVQQCEAGRGPGEQQWYSRVVGSGYTCRYLVDLSAQRASSKLYDC